MPEFLVQEQQLGKVTRATVKDQTGRSFFLLVGRWGTRGDTLSLYIMSREILASIKQVSWAFGTRFELYQRFKKVGILRKLFSLNADFYYVQGLHWAVVGDIKAHQYSIYQVHKKITPADKAILCIGDYFVLAIANDGGVPLCICIAAVLGYWLYNKKKQETSDDFGLDFDPLMD